jgi:hypothetical protein
MVDLTLASTYLPAVTCLIRSALVIFLISRESVMRSVAALIGTGIALYLDRLIRRESIFDSSALTCTVFVAHVLNLCRSGGIATGGAVSADKALPVSATAKDARHYHARLRTQLLGEEEDVGAPFLYDERGQHRMDLNTSSASSSNHPPPIRDLADVRYFIDSTAEASRPPQSPPPTMMSRMARPIELRVWQEDVIYLLYMVSSIMLLLDIDAIGMMFPSSKWTKASINGCGSSDACYYIDDGDGDSDGEESRISSHPSSVRSPPVVSSSSSSSSSLSSRRRRFRSSKEEDSCGRSGKCAVDESDAMGAGTAGCHRLKSLHVLSTLGGTGNSNVVRVSTVLVHCILLCLVLQVRVDTALFLSPAKVVLRSAVFVVISIVWTYAVGINDCSFSVRRFPYFMHATDIRPCPDVAAPEYVPAASSGHGSSLGVPSAKLLYSACKTRIARTSVLAPFVQPFTACQLRFAILLFADRWFFVASAISMGLVVGERLHRLVCSLSLAASNGDSTCRAAVAIGQTITNEDQGRISGARVSNMTSTLSTLSDPSGVPGSYVRVALNRAHSNHAQTLQEQSILFTRGDYDVRMMGTGQLPESENHHGNDGKVEEDEDAHEEEEEGYDDEEDEEEEEQQQQQRGRLREDAEMYRMFQTEVASSRESHTAPGGLVMLTQSGGVSGGGGAGYHVAGPVVRALPAHASSSASSSQSLLLMPGAAKVQQHSNMGSKASSENDSYDQVAAMFRMAQQQKQQASSSHRPVFGISAHGPMDGGAAAGSDAGSSSGGASVTLEENLHAIIAARRAERSLGEMI